VQAPVGIYLGNGFGLHDVIGNLYEWCRDGYSTYAAPLRAGDGLRSRTSLDFRVARSGPYSSPTSAHRSSARSRFPPDFTNPFVGVRPAIYPLAGR
jgi:formylglycine-generating enzyme required for sulfatase activity